jgi:hypothetical protein
VPILRNLPGNAFSVCAWRKGWVSVAPAGLPRVKVCICV